jgi:hypothetical protein
LSSWCVRTIQARGGRGRCKRERRQVLPSGEKYIP